MFAYFFDIYDNSLHKETLRPIELNFLLRL